MIHGARRSIHINGEHIGIEGKLGECKLFKSGRGRSSRIILSKSSSQKLAEA